MTRDMLDADSAAGASTLMVHCDAGIRMGMPESGWSRDELSGRARWENEHIGQSRYCAPRYWYLGKILLLVQEEVEQGRWELWCKEPAIHRNRWRRGRLLALAFASPDEVAGLTVQAAEALAREALGLPQRQTAADAKLRRSLTSVKKTLADRLPEVGGVTKAAGLRLCISELKRQLTALGHACVVLERSRRVGPSKPPHAKRRK